MTLCRYGHQHSDWAEAFRCDHDTVSERDPAGRLIESAPEQPQQAALDFDAQ